MKIWIVDAFADRPFAGNPAAVAVVDEFPDDETCQNIAAEMNLSATAFVKRLGTNHFHIRWNTPKAVARICGHATLAASHIIHQENLVSGKDIVFESLFGTLKVHSSSPSNYTLDFPASKTETAIEVPIKCNFGEVVEAARVDNNVIIELANEEQVRKYVPRINELAEIDCPIVVITSKGTGKYDFISRCFAPRMGNNEDPVCGSAHCKLAFYWRKRLNKSNFVAYQGSTRGGEIRISIVGDRVHLSGRAVTVLSGEWQVPCQKI